MDSYFTRVQLDCILTLIPNLDKDDRLMQKGAELSELFLDWLFDELSPLHRYFDKHRARIADGNRLIVLSDFMNTYMGQFEAACLDKFSWSGFEVFSFFGYHMDLG